MPTKSDPRRSPAGNQPLLLAATSAALSAVVIALLVGTGAFLFGAPAPWWRGGLAGILGSGLCLQLGRVLLRAALRPPGRYCGDELPTLRAVVVPSNQARASAAFDDFDDGDPHDRCDGQLFFFVHGWPDGPATWADTIATLHAAHPRAKCVAVALPHFPSDGGDDAAPPSLGKLLRQTDFPAVVEALRRSMIGHGASATAPAVVIAHDWGASYAFRLQAESPALVDRLVCIDVGSHVAWTRAQWRGILRYQLPISTAFLFERRGDDVASVSWRLRAGYTAGVACALGAPDPVKPPSINYPYFWFHLRLLANLLRLGPGAGFPEVTDEHLHGGSAVPSCPLLYVYGTQKGNPPINFHSQEWIANVAETPGCRVLGAAAGHWVQKKATAELCQAISAFLWSKPSDGAGRPRRRAQHQQPRFEYRMLDLGIESGLLLLTALVALDLRLTGSWWWTLADSTLFRMAMLCWGLRVLASSVDLGLPVAPGGHFLRGHDFGSRSHKIKRQLAAACGSVFGVRQEYRMQVVASDPAVIRAVTAAGSGAERQSRFQDSLEKVLTSGVPSIFTLPEGEEWSARRKSVVGFFAPANLRAFVPEINARLRECDAVLLRHSVAPLTAATTVDLSELMIRFTFDVIGDVVLDHDFGAVRSDGSDVQSLIATLISETIARMYSPWRKYTAAGAAGTQAQQALWEFGRRCVQDYVGASGKQGAAESTPRQHLIGHMPWIKRSVRSGAALTRDELDATVADLITFLVAGHETTGHTLAWTLWLISTHPEVEQKLLDDLVSTPPDGRMESGYLAAVINESMRLKPASANGTGRVLKRDLWIAPHGCPALKLSKGQAVNCAFFTTHTAETIWGADADDFRPERWLQRVSTEARAHTAGSAAAHHERQGHFMPFSAGPRNCAGRNLAMLEIKVALAHLLPQWRFVPDPRSPVDELCGINLEPRYGIKVTVQARGARLPGG